MCIAFHCSFKCQMRSYNKSKMTNLIILDVDALECPVCLQICVHPSKLPCGHIFCFLCVKVSLFIVIFQQKKQWILTYKWNRDSKIVDVLCVEPNFQVNFLTVLNCCCQLTQQHHQQAILKQIPISGFIRVIMVCTIL